VHLLGCALEYPAATTCKKSVADKCEFRATIGDVAGGVARDVENLKVETEVWKGNDIAVLDRVVDGGDIFSSRTEYRDLTHPENLVDAANVITVVVGEEDSAKLQFSLPENLEHERCLSRIYNHRRRRRRVRDEPDVIVGESGYGFEKGHESMLPGNGGNSQSPEDWK